MDNLILLLLLVKCVPFIMTIAIIFSLILLVVISGNINNSPVTNGRIKLLQYLTISNLVGQIAVFGWFSLNQSNIKDKQLFLPCLSFIQYFAFYDAVIFSMSLGLNLCIFQFELSFNRKVYYFPQEILSRWWTYVISAIAIPLWPIMLGFILTFDVSKKCYFNVTFRGMVTVLSIVFNLLIVLSSLFSSRWIRSNLSDEDRDTALSVINKYFIPTLILYPLTEAIGQAPLLIYDYYFDCSGEQVGHFDMFCILLIWFLSYPITSITHLILFQSIEESKFSWRILLQRLNMNFIVKAFEFLVRVSQNNLAQAANMYQPIDDGNTDNETLDQLSQIISHSSSSHTSVFQSADSESNVSEAV
eukprot:gene3246-3459_t